MKIMQLDRFAMLHQSVGKGILLGLETREQKRRTFETSFETLKTLTSKCLQESLCLTQLLMKPHISSATTNISAHDTNLRLFGDILDPSRLSCLQLSLLPRQQIALCRLRQRHQRHRLISIFSSLHELLRDGSWSPRSSP